MYYYLSKFVYCMQKEWDYIKWKEKPKVRNERMKENEKKKTERKKEECLLIKNDYGLTYLHCKDSFI